MILVDTRRLLAAFRGDDRFLRKSFQDYFYCIAENKMEDTHATHTHTHTHTQIIGKVFGKMNSQMLMGFGW